MLIKFNLSIASFKKILADIHTKNVAEQEIILTSPSGICFIAKYPIVIPQVPSIPLPNNLSLLPFGNIGSFLKKIFNWYQKLISRFNRFSYKGKHFRTICYFFTPEVQDADRNR